VDVAGLLAPLLTTAVAIVGSTEGGPHDALIEQVHSADALVQVGTSSVTLRTVAIGSATMLVVRGDATFEDVATAIARTTPAVVVLAEPLISSHRVSEATSPPTERWLEVLARHRVALVVASGVPGYERLHLGGTAHLVSGGGLVGPAPSGAHPSSVVSADAYTLVRVSGDPLLVEVSTIEGTLLDRIHPTFGSAQAPQQRQDTQVYLLAAAALVLVGFGYVIARVVAP